MAISLLCLILLSGCGKTFSGKEYKIVKKDVYVVYDFGNGKIGYGNIVLQKINKQERQVER